MNIPTYNVSLSLNVVKSVLFRVSSLALQFTVYKLFTLLASHTSAFTSYLMLHEELYQKMLYIASRGLHRHSLLVAGFIALFAAAAMWDTMLWALDSPGFIMYQSRTTSDRLYANQRSDAHGGYAVLAGTGQGLDGLNLARDLAEGLWEGINVTLAGVVDIGTPRVVSTRNYEGPEVLGPGPRIWLDDEGLSVVLDWSAAVIAYDETCVLDEGSKVTSRWSCESDYYTSITPRNNFQAGFALPSVYWDSGSIYDADDLTTERGVNPWHVMGTGGGSVILKQVFTVTKGTRRHVFLMTAWKATIMAESTEVLSLTEIEDLVRRTWQKGGADAELTEVLDHISSAVRNDRALNAGERTESPYTVTSRLYKYYKAIISPTNQTFYTAFQVCDANITLVRSETIPSPPVPYGTCDTWFRNNARGGKVQSNSCPYNKFPGRGSRFLGQVDISTVLVLDDTLGKRVPKTSSEALNETAWSWLNNSNHEIDALVLSRAYILGVNPSDVQVDTTNYKPAATVLQLILVAVPFLAAAIVYVLVLFRAKLNYQASLLANLAATTHEGYNCEKPEYMKNPPEVILFKREYGTYLGTQTGVFWHTAREEPEGFGTAREEPEGFGDAARGITENHTGESGKA